MLCPTSWGQASNVACETYPRCESGWLSYYLIDHRATAESKKCSVNELESSTPAIDRKVSVGVDLRRIHLILNYRLNLAEVRFFHDSLTSRLWHINGLDHRPFLITIPDVSKD